MFRSLSSLVVLGLCVGFAAADKNKSAPRHQTDKNAKEAVITRMDAKKGTVTVKLQSDGKEVEKTFTLAKDIEYTDSTGKLADGAHFAPGDMVTITEHGGEITKMKKDASEATITKVDAKKGTVTVKMKSAGRDVEKTFKLAEDIEYMDSTGRVAAVDLFTSGDLVLIVEREGKIAKMKKHDKSDTRR